MSKKLLPIQLRGAKENNLKNLDLDIYPGQLVVITGLSGTGKSTLLFDVLHAEGQRRYVETFSPYVRQFMEALPRPNIQSMANARPSIAVEQKNSVKNSRSTVGTMTELCDYFKIWFPQVAQLHDPDHKSSVLSDENPNSLTKALLKEFPDRVGVFGFWIDRGKLPPKEFLQFLIAAGHTKILHAAKFKQIKELIGSNWKEVSAFVVIDRTPIIARNRGRVIEAISLALEKGQGLAEARTENGDLLKELHLGFRSSKTGRRFKKLGTGSFSFNSPIGACSECKGFGRVIEINPSLVIPDSSLSLANGAIKPFAGKVYGHCLTELLHFCKSQAIDPTAPWKELPQNDKDFIWNGDPDHEDGDDRWYGIRSFFEWLEKKTYKMHVRVFLSKYRGYFRCPACNGSRFKKEPQLWKWKMHSLPEIYSMPVSELLDFIKDYQSKRKNYTSLALDAISTRLQYLSDVGLGYLSLDRSARTLSGGETQRINLTACLGAGLTDTLFALDEPTVGLHHQDIGRLIKILRDLADAGNCVCVVEHDETVIQSADKVIEIGPEPGNCGGAITFQGTVPQLLRSKVSPTGKWLSQIQHAEAADRGSKFTKPSGWLHIQNAKIHNLNKFNAKLPLGKFTCIAGLSGSGKSTLLHDLIYNELSQGFPNGWVSCTQVFSEVVMIDQNTLARSPRSNPVLFADAWSPVKEAFGRTEKARSSGFSATDFSFNSGQGRCEACMGLGYQVVELQFLPDLTTPCQTCSGKRFKEELLEITLDGLNVAEVLDLPISEARGRFSHLPKTHKKLSLLSELGLGYLKLGQPLSTLSGGESQRLKLAKYMGPLDKSEGSAVLFLDEPTTGLHLADIDRLITCLRKVVSGGHTLFVIEHNATVLRQADWIVELGPGAGKNGGKVIAEGIPSKFSALRTPTSKLLWGHSVGNPAQPSSLCSPKKSAFHGKRDLEIFGAKENNLQNIDLKIPANQFVVISGPSGSGKSSLAFDVIFAEGQRRFLESMSSYAKQFVQQIGKPRVDHIAGISPTVAIEQRVTRGSKKSTVGSITEISQYMRLLYARLGVQHSPTSGKALVSSTPHEICRSLISKISGQRHFRILAPLVTNRKGHHKPLVNWARGQGFSEVCCDGEMVSTEAFEGLDRYKAHDIEVVIHASSVAPKGTSLNQYIKLALEIGNGRCLAVLENKERLWFSIHKFDPATGDAYPELEPATLSWNSPRGWCEYCRGYGKIYDWMKDELPASGEWWKLKDGDLCPSCNGERLGPVGRNVFLRAQNSAIYSLPKLLKIPPADVKSFLSNLKVRPSEKPILDAILPEVFERLNFMGRVGLDYLSLDRETSSLSGGESQRIRLAGQLGSNLSGVLYVLDEPSIGLHPSDNQKLIDSLRELQARGNSLLVVEHDQETINQADCVIEIGPEAGEKGGRVLQKGSPHQLTQRRLKSPEKFLPEGIKHPLREKWRTIPRKNGKKNLFLELSRVNVRNLKNIDISIPLNRFIVCCGVSGAGKSTLIKGALLKGVKRAIDENSSVVDTESYSLRQGNVFSKVIEVSQSPIGKTSRSTPATYLGAWKRIRDLMITLPEAQARGFKSSDFSFNVKGGRCENCQGAGRLKIEMNFLPDSYITCEECNGMRYKDEVLELMWRNKNIAEILEMTFEQAVEFFSFEEKLKETFQLMTDTGLGYLRLGQISPTLSGGEAQRLKLATELAKGIELKGRLLGKTKCNLYILEEPTIGLHSKDCEKLIHLLHRLVDEGHTVVVIEHDIDLIAEADYLIELGPKGGNKGGRLLHQGSVKSLLSKKRSPTAPFIQKVLRN